MECNSGLYAWHPADKSSISAGAESVRGAAIGRPRYTAAVCLTLSAAGAFLLFATAGAAAEKAPSAVRLHEEPLVIPTYEVGPPDRNPIFYSGRTYQGAKGPVYPYPILDKLTDVKKDKTYKAVYLENEYVKYCILPELGGRIFSAVDKTNGYDFVYRQHVIKPALIGMLGAWISGGIEWNIPHHHRATTFMPVDYKLMENTDGSKTCWLGEIELRHRMKWLVGLTLFPGRSDLEVTVRIINRTPLPHSILYFANIAVHANEDYQVIFPPSTQYGTQHAKSEFVHWPIGQECYGGLDRTGVDLSWWKNHPAPLSIFAWNDSDDFFGGYDHGKKAGIAIVADHHVAPGKKFFLWGNGPESKMWDRMLTDTDGPYIELMAGAWSDNQPDYSWIQPYETKTVKQYIYPIRELGGIKYANTEAAVNLEVDKEGKVTLVVNGTRKMPLVLIALDAGKRRVKRLRTALSPDKPYHFEMTLPANVKRDELSVVVEEVLGVYETTRNENPLDPDSPQIPTLAGRDKRVLVEYHYPAGMPKAAPMPQPVVPPASPRDIPSNDELYLAGLRLEQFYSPAREPYPYYEEALRRDPGDYRVNTAMGILYLKRGMREEALRCLDKAVERATRNYTQPKDAEAFYYRGVANRQTGNDDAAKRDLEKAAQYAPWSAAAYYNLAEMACREADQDLHTRRRLFPGVLELLAVSARNNPNNPRAFVLASAAYRALEEFDEGDRMIDLALAIDPLDAWANYEKEFLIAERRFQIPRKRGGDDDDPPPRDEAADRKLEQKMAEVEAEFRRLTRNFPPTLLEVAADYHRCGLKHWARSPLSDLVRRNPGSGRLHLRTLPTPGSEGIATLAVYHLADYDRDTESKPLRDLCAELTPDYGFPFQHESADVLRHFIEDDKMDAHAPYFLGNLLYDHQPKKAIKAWEESRKRDPKFSTVHRNLAFGYAHHENNVPKAIASLERAIECDSTDPRYYAELDVLYEAAGTAPEKRLAMLENHHDVVKQRDDALGREIAVHVLLGHYDRAIELLAGHHFHLWEGGRSVHEQYVDAHLLRGRERMKAKKYSEALKDFQAAQEYPDNLEAARPRRGSGRGAEIAYFIATAHEALGDKAAAEKHYRESTQFTGTQPEQDYYQGLSQQKLGEPAKATELFDKLVREGEQRLVAPDEVDFFAKFGGKQSPAMRKADAHYLIGLGLLGKDKKAEAEIEFRKALDANAGHLGARTMAERR